MDIQISVRHFELTDALRDRIHEKLEKIKRHHQHITRIHVVLETDHQRNKISATLHLPGREIRVETSTSDMYASIDDVSKKLVRQLEKYKKNH